MERERNNHLPPQETISVEAYVGMYLGKTGVPVCSKEEVYDVLDRYPIPIRSLPCSILLIPYPI